MLGLLLVVVCRTQTFQRAKNSISAGIDAQRRDVRPANDPIAIDDEQGALADAILLAIDAIIAGHLSLGLKIGQERKVQLSIAGISGVAPDAIDGNSDELRPVLIEL